MINSLEKKKKLFLFTGITPTGDLTLGHYFGIIKHLLKLQKDYEIIFMIADLHALTNFSSEINYQLKGREIAACLLACGLKKKKCRIFLQSSVSAHAELFFLLSPFVSVDKLKNMIQYKEKINQKKSSNLALFSYPVLMAADIFLYDVDLVVVGLDQKQHTELISKIAKNFNGLFSDSEKLLKIPRFFFPPWEERF